MQFIDTVTTDTETGGLYAAIHCLLAIGAKCSWSEETFQVFINPQTGKLIEEAAAKKNGYTPEKWAARGAVPIDDAIPAFLAWVDERKKERPGAVLLCHNLAFDKGFLQEGARVLNLELPHRNDWVCSQVEFTKLMRQGVIEAGSSSLDRLKELSGWTGVRCEEHDALEDARITEHGYRWLIEQASARENGLSDLAGGRLQRIKELERAAIFPRTPERDADGNALLYPGSLNYEGVAAVFGGQDLGEWVILAPTAEALEARCRLHDIADELHRDRCRIARLEPMSN